MPLTFSLAVKKRTILAILFFFSRCSLDKTPFAQHCYTEFFEGAIRELSKMLNRMSRNLNIINILFITCS